MRILVVDDEYLIAVTIEETLRDAGADVVSAATLPTAMKATEDATLSAAVLDVRLGRHTSEPVADALAARGIPFVFYSGQVLPDSLRSKHPGVKTFSKPIKPSTFVWAILDAVRQRW